MRVAFVVERKNYYRLLGPVVDAALARGWTVICLHDYAQPRRGIKGYEFPAVDMVPPFRHGVPRLEIYHGSDSLADTIRTIGSDAVVSIVSPPLEFREKRAVSTMWIGLQYAAEILYHLIPPAGPAIDLIGLYSAWWLEFGLRVLRARGVTVPGDGLEREILRKSAVVGFPELDAFQMIDSAEVRQRWGIPPGKPVVALLPYPFGSNPQTLWSRWVYRPGNPVWRRLRLHLAGEQRLESLLMEGWDDLAVTRAVRAFCDANSACLLVKARAKDPVPRYLARVADFVVYDEAYYPPTILEVLAVADLCVHFYSSTVLEAVGCGVPSLSICPELNDMGTPLDWQPLFYTREEGSAFQFRGVAETIGIAEAIECLSRKRLADFVAEPASRKRYTEKFLGFDDGRSSSRLLDLIVRLVEDGHCVNRSSQVRATADDDLA